MTEIILKHALTSDPEIPTPWLRSNKGQGS